MLSKERLNGLLFAIMGSNTLVKRWWNKPHQDLDNKPPVEVYESDPKRVTNVILKVVNRECK